MEGTYRSDSAGRRDCAHGPAGLSEGVSEHGDGSLWMKGEMENQLPAQLKERRYRDEMWWSWGLWYEGNWRFRRSGRSRWELELVDARDSKRDFSRDNARDIARVTPGIW